MDFNSQQFSQQYSQQYPQQYSQPCYSGQIYHSPSTQTHTQLHPIFQHAKKPERNDNPKPPKKGVSTKQKDVSFDDALIEQVREYRCIYDVSSENYKDRTKKKNAWLSIAAVLKQDGKSFVVLFFSLTILFVVKTCQKKWKNLRDQFNRERKAKPSGSSGATKAKWCHFESMSFLSMSEPIDDPTSSTNSLDSDTDSETRSVNDDGGDFDDSQNPSQPTPTFTSNVKRGTKRAAVASIDQQIEHLSTFLCKSPKPQPTPTMEDGLFTYLKGLYMALPADKQPTASMQLMDILMKLQSSS